MTQRPLHIYRRTESKTNLFFLFSCNLSFFLSFFFLGVGGGWVEGQGKALYTHTHTEPHTQFINISISIIIMRYSTHGRGDNRHSNRIYRSKHPPVPHSQRSIGWRPHFIVFCSLLCFSILLSCFLFLLLSINIINVTVFITIIIINTDFSIHEWVSFIAPVVMTVVCLFIS